MSEQKKPALEIDDEIVIVERALIYRATVLEIRRVWIIIRREGWQRAESFRLDTRTPYASGKNYSGTPRFYTLAEWAERERETADRVYLSAQGITLNREAGTPWTPHTLATALRAMSDVPKLIELIETYGYECACGGQGYTSDGSDALFTKIKELLTGGDANSE